MHKALAVHVRIWIQVFRSCVNVRRSWHSGGDGDPLSKLASLLAEFVSSRFM